MYGCGCWAQGNPGYDRVATSTSGKKACCSPTSLYYCQLMSYTVFIGVGETLIKTCLARDVTSSV